MMIKKEKKKIILFAALALLGMQAVFLVCTNLFCIPETMDNDAAKLFLHAIEIWKKKEIFLPAWHNQTTLETDCPLLIAFIIYGICGNIYVSFGIANILTAVFTLFVVYLILKQEKVSLTVSIFTCALMIIPYSFGQLLYYNMTYFAGGQYAVKILVPLLMLYLFNAGDKNRSVWYVLAVICCFLNYVCGVSGGPYTFLTGSLPVMVGALCVGIFFRKKEKKLRPVCRETLLALAVTVFSVAGVFISHIKNVGSTSMDINLITFDEVTDSFFEIFRSYFEYLGSFPYYRIPVISLQGIMHTFRAFWAILLAAGLFYYTKKFLGSFFSGEKDAYPEEGNEPGIEVGLVFVVIFNFIILWFTGGGTQPRYLAVPVAMIIILEGMFLDRVRSLRGVILAGISVLVFFIALLSDMDVVRGNCFPAMKEENERIAEVLGVLDGYDEEQVIFLDDTSSAEYARLTKYGNGKTYLAYNTTADSFNYRGVIVNDYYMDVTDASNIGEDHILVVNEDIADMGDLPEYIRDLYEETGECRGFRIYRSKRNLMDGVAGILYNDHAIDFCFTDGYEIRNGEIGEDGRLSAKGDGGQIISGPLLGERKGSLDVSIYYEAEGDGDVAGRIELWDVYSHEMAGSADLLTSGSKAEISDIPLEGRNLAVIVVLDEGFGADVDRFEYDVKNKNV